MASSLSSILIFVFLSTVNFVANVMVIKKILFEDLSLLLVYNTLMLFIFDLALLIVLAFFCDLLIIYCIMSMKRSRANYSETFLYSQVTVHDTTSTSQKNSAPFVQSSKSSYQECSSSDYIQ